MIRRLPWLLFAAAVSGACAASLLALWADAAWLAELAVHFRLQYFAIALFAAPVLMWRRSLPLAAAAITTLVLNAGPAFGQFETRLAASSAAIAPLAAERASDAVANAGSPPVVATTDPARRVPLRIASANVFFVNADYAAVTDWARRTRPDVLLLLEATAAWRSGVAALEAEYPHVRYVTDRSHHGLLLLSQWPLSEVVTRPATARTMRPVLFATLEKDGARLRLAAMHATWPMRPANARQRQLDLDALAAEAARRGGLPFVGVGDLNISPFSPYYQRMLQVGGLRSAAAGQGWQPTWPAFFLPLGIQIDHALVSPEVEVRAFRRGPPNGSDHLPIVVDVLIPKING